MSRILIIAEAGVNHNGSLDCALEMIDVAVAAGADAIKFQTFKSADVLSRHAAKAPYQIETTPASESQLEMARKLELDEAAHVRLASRCREKRIEFMSSPFDLGSVDFLASTLEVARIKIGSGEITNFPLLHRAARTGKPMLLSTGMSSLGDIEAALGVIAHGYLCADPPPTDLTAFAAARRSDDGRRVLRQNVTLLHCTTEYPAPFEDVNLRAVDTLHAAFGLPTGLSDHTPGIAVAIAAAARGAAVIEKHFTLNHDLPGPDHRASLEPADLAEMVRSIRQVESALGDGIKISAPGERLNAPVVRKSLVAAKPIVAGERFTCENLTTKRPGTGISAMYYWTYLSTVATRDYEEDELIDEPPLPAGYAGFPCRPGNR